MSLITVRGIQKLVSKGNVVFFLFCINIFFFQDFLWWESPSLKSSCTHICIRYAQSQICMFVCKWINTKSLLGFAEVLPVPCSQTLKHPGSPELHPSQEKSALGLPTPHTPSSLKDCAAIPVLCGIWGHWCSWLDWISSLDSPCSDPPWALPGLSCGKSTAEM